MKKILSVLLLTICSALLFACGNKAESKVDEATVEAYTKKSEEIITLLLEKDFDSVHAMFDDALKEQTSLEQMAKYGAVIDEAGPFKGFDRTSVQKEDNQLVVVTVAYHSEVKRIYSFTFNEQEEITAIYIK